MITYPFTGRCLCGRVTFAALGPIAWQCHCHCESCRRATSAPFTTFLGVPSIGVTWTGAAPAVFRSSPGVERRFCGHCGTPMAFQAEWYPGETDLYAASLDDPTVIRPEFHVHIAEKLPWVGLSDDLPKYPHGYTEPAGG